MRAYTIQQDKPWVSAPKCSSGLSMSAYVKDTSAAAAHDGSAPRTQSGYHPSYHAHPRQQIKDHGPQIRQSRLPIFKQVRSMLNRPPPITTPNNPKWDEYTGELSESGKAPSVKPSAYVSPYQDALQTSKQRSPERLKKHRKNQSPVSVLRDDEQGLVHEATEADVNLVNKSPVSPMSQDSWENDEVEDEFDQSLLPDPLSPNVQRAAQQTSPSSQMIKRKPVLRCTSSEENYPPVSPPQSPSQSSDTSAHMAGEKYEDAREHPRSHFSWTTYAPTVAPRRQSTDTMATQQARDVVQEPRSRFSWSTVATQHLRPASPPPSSPLTSDNHSTLPMQSILSRQRPIQRNDRSEWVQPPPIRGRSGTTPDSATPTGASTPLSAGIARQIKLPSSSIPSSNSPTNISKALPPPPQLASAHDLTHLETLLAQERDITLQRTNIERGIRETEKIEKASPMDVPFATVRDAKKRLAEYRTRLDEIKLEQRDIGVAISRARRKEEKEHGGDGETLWVRRVTG